MCGEIGAMEERRLFGIICYLVMLLRGEGQGASFRSFSSGSAPTRLCHHSIHPPFSIL